MATAYQHPPMMMTEEEYLNHFSFEPDAEFTDGIVEERPVGTIEHSRWQQAIMLWFAQHKREWAIESLPEVRVRLRPGMHRVPDVTILDATKEKAKGKIVTATPLAVFEILSPDESMRRIRRKFAEYDEAEIPHIWFVDPDKGVWQRYIDGVLVPTERFLYETEARKVFMGIDFMMTEITALAQV
jgi:Uma2 family endonuclease